VGRVRVPRGYWNGWMVDGWPMVRVRVKVPVEWLSDGGRDAAFCRGGGGAVL
jgi:hypothetical protein